MSLVIFLFSWLVATSYGFYVGGSRFHAKELMLGNFLGIAMILVCPLLYFNLGALPTSVVLLALTSALIRKVIITYRYTGPLHASRRYVYLIPHFFLTAAMLYHIVLAPVSAWDTLGHWSPLSLWVLEAARINSFNELVVPGLHPATISMLPAFVLSESVSSLHDGSIFYFAWLLLSINFCLAVYCFCWSLVPSSSVSAAVAYCCISMPLAENHFTLVGYADIFLAVCLSAVAITSYVFLDSSDRRFLCLLILFVALLPLIKNTGYVYSLGVAAIWLVGLFRRRVVFGLLVAISGFLVCLYFGPGFHICVIGSCIGWDPAQNEISLAGRQLQLFTPAALEILTNYLFSRGLNASFSIAALFEVAVIGLGVFLFFFPRPGLCRSERMTLFLLCFLVSFLLSTQFTSYGFRFSDPGLDTGLSRFSLTIFLPFLASLPIIISKLYEREPMGDVA